MISSDLLRFHSSCVNVFAEFGAYVWDETKNEDAVIKENDHAMDAMRYFMYTVIAREKRAGVF